MHDSKTKTLNELETLAANTNGELGGSDKEQQRDKKRHFLFPGKN
jgi:hypothetical protein